MSIKYYHELDQGSDEWLMARLGIVTASEVNELVTPNGHNKLTPKKNGEIADGVISYACEIASQRVNNRIEDRCQTYAMAKGTFYEKYARGDYSDNYATVSECGFITRKFDTFTLGCSPDGLVGDDGGIEIKSRLRKFHLGVVRSKEVPKEYVNQCQAFLLVSGRKWVDFVHYHSGMALFVKKVLADEVRQKTIIDALEAFEILVKETESMYIEASKSMVPTEYVEFSIDGEIEGSDEGEGDE